MSEKVFDRLDLLSIFSESDSAARVGRFIGWKTTDDHGRVTEPKPVVHEVFANIAAYYCEKGGFAIIRFTVMVSQDYLLSEYRDELPVLSIKPVWEALNNVTNNADLMRRVVNMADTWRLQVKDLIPDDLAKPFVNLAPDAPMLDFDEETKTGNDGPAVTDAFDIVPHHPND